LTIGRPKCVFVTDCEGPISKNDNAYELTSHFIPNGDKFFSVVSRYDDALAYIIKKRDYKAGNTLKLILPFLKAYGVTNQKMIDFAARDIMLLPGAKATMQFVQEIMPSFIVSTSYEQYISALCKAIDFPLENTCSTQVDIDRHQIAKEEAQTLRQLTKEIAAMHSFQIPKNAGSLEHFSLCGQATIKRLDEIFWNKIPKMRIGKMFDEVNPVGGEEKAKATNAIVTETGSSVSSVMYVGDSITDVECFRYVRNGDGLTISLNGNEYAVREAEIAAMSENTIVTSILADVFAKHGREKVLQLAQEWSLSTLKKFEVNHTLVMNVQRLYPHKLPRVKAITKGSMGRLAEESIAFRKSVRGKAIARLG
jgi:energy-converting hydrogenase A subunit R